jgi:hypothetical protein
LGTVVWWLIPPDDREHVFGDLQERLQSPGRVFLLDAVTTVPLVVWSRMHRVMRRPAFVLQALVLPASFVVTAAVMYKESMLLSEHGLFRVATPVLWTLITLLLAETYGRVALWNPLTHLLWVALALGVGWATNAVFSRVGPAYAVPDVPMLHAVPLAFMSVSCVRFFFVFRGEVPMSFTKAARPPILCHVCGKTIDPRDKRFVEKNRTTKLERHTHGACRKAGAPSLPPSAFPRD